MDMGAGSEGIPRNIRNPKTLVHVLTDEDKNIITVILRLRERGIKANLINIANHVRLLTHSEEPMQNIVEKLKISIEKTMEAGLIHKKGDDIGSGLQTMLSWLHRNAGIPWEDRRLMSGWQLTSRLESTTYS